MEILLQYCLDKEALTAWRRLGRRGSTRTPLEAEPACAHLAEEITELVNPGALRHRFIEFHSRQLKPANRREARLPAARHLLAFRWGRHGDQRLETQCVITTLVNPPARLSTASSASFTAASGKRSCSNTSSFSVPASAIAAMPCPSSVVNQHEPMSDF